MSTQGDPKVEMALNACRGVLKEIKAARQQDRWVNSAFVQTLMESTITALEAPEPTPIPRVTYQEHG